MAEQSQGSQIAVFLGPTLLKNRAAALLSADYYPPARKGDIYYLIPSGVKTIILIDGVFHSTSSIWQREIMDALAEGIQVIGASSMGALRAAELYPFGMVGCGTIFEWYRDGVIDGDDEVALHHGDVETEFYPLSEPLVNIRYTLLQAAKAHCITQEQAELLIAYAKQLHYPRRSYRQLLQSPILQNWTPQAKQQFEKYLSTNNVNLKMNDAIKALNQCKEIEHHTLIRHRKSQPNTDSPWHGMRFFLAGFFGSSGSVKGSKMTQQVWQNTDLQTNLRTKLSKDCFLLQWAKQNNVVCPSDHLETFIQQYEVNHSIDRQGKWLKANGLTENVYRYLLSKRALINWIIRQEPAYFEIEWHIEAAVEAEKSLMMGIDRTQESVTDQQQIITQLKQDLDLRIALSERGFLLAWATQNGVSLPVSLVEQAIAQWQVKHQIQVDADCLHVKNYLYLSCREHILQRALVNWILEKGPAYFGLNWELDTAFLNELQITGHTKRILDNMEVIC